MPIVGRITIDSRTVGVIHVSLGTGDDATYPPDLDHAIRPQGLLEDPSGVPFGRDIGPGYRDTDTGRDGHGGGHRGRDGHYIPDGAREPRPPEKPEHFTTKDIRAAVEGETTLKGSAYLQRERKWIADELNADPKLRRYVAGVITHEQSSGERSKVFESLANRLNYFRAHGQPNLTLREYLSRTGSSQFYGPIRRGEINEAYLHRLEGIPGETESTNREIDRVLGGSNDLRGMTDQGSRGDPNFGVGETVMSHGEGYNDFGRGAARGWRLEQQRRVNEGGTVGGVPIGKTSLDPGSPGTPRADGGGAGPVNYGTLTSPITGELWQGPGAARPGHIHQGVDIGAPVGTPVKASLGAGTVIHSQLSGHPTGNIISIKYDNGLVGSYMHLSQRNLKVGDRVNADTVLGLSGYENGAHLHYEVSEGRPIYAGGHRLDPAVVHGWGHFGAHGEGLRGTRVSSSPHSSPAAAKEPAWHWKPDKVNPVVPPSPGLGAAREDTVFPRTASSSVPDSAFSGPPLPRSLANERARFSYEMKVDPGVQDRLFRLIQTENPQNPQAFIENVMNRASARNTTLSAAMNDRNYYPRVSLIGAKPENTTAMYQALHNVTSGSNITNFATGNASGKVGFGYGKGAKDPYTYKDPRSGERYGIENRPSDITWARRMAAFDPSQEE